MRTGAVGVGVFEAGEAGVEGFLGHGGYEGEARRGRCRRGVIPRRYLCVIIVDIIQVSELGAGVKGGLA